MLLLHACTDCRGLAKELLLLLLGSWGCVCGLLRWRWWWLLVILRNLTHERCLLLLRWWWWLLEVQRGLGRKCCCCLLLGHVCGLLLQLRWLLAMLRSLS